MLFNSPTFRYGIIAAHFFFVSFCVYLETTLIVLSATHKNNHETLHVFLDNKA